MVNAGLYDVCHEAGGMTAYEWDRDPKRLAFILSRYKFVAKMFTGYGSVLEVGCADGFASRIVRQEVHSMTAIDIDEASIVEAKLNSSVAWPITFHQHDIMVSPLQGFGGVFALDVFEHIRNADRFLDCMAGCAPVAIIGTPSLESQQYASALSKEGHVNCHTSTELRYSLRRYWNQVFMFSMNDEVLHTGFGPMSQYLFALCVGPRR